MSARPRLFPCLPGMNTGMERLLTELDSVEDTHQNFSSGKDGQVSTQSKNSRNVEPSGIPEKEYHTILVNEEVEKQLAPNAPTPTDNEDD